MRRTIRDYIEHAESASNSDQLRDAIAIVIGPFDFNAFAFLALPDLENPPFLVFNYDERWQTRHIVQGHERRDPVRLHSSAAAKWPRD